ncbi:MAG: DUF4340 domain-containing protein [Prevotellaceae bacterium]|jgi:hypothetical protein|nr:DUF4340 domain-containing protein [Prevotellaceae bacterium]
MIYTLYKKTCIGAGLSLLMCCNTSYDRFAIDGIDKITRIELTGNQQQTTLVRIDENDWRIASNKANMRKIANLKTILAALEVQYPLPKIYENIYSPEKLRQGVRVKAYREKRTVTDYYLLFSDTLGATGMLNSSTKVFVVDFPAQDVNLEEYFVSDPIFWENNLAFSIMPERIKSVRIENGNEPANSFTIKQDGDSIRLFDSAGNRHPCNKLKAEQYLSYFGKVSYEHSLNIGETEKNGITTAKPMYIVNIETDNENIICFVYPIADNGMDDYGQPLVYNRDFFNLVMPQKGIFAKAKWLEFDILLKEIVEFE